MSSPSSSHSSVVLLGVTQKSDNYGVRVLLSAAAEALSEAYPENEIAVLDYANQPQVWEEFIHGENRKIPLINLRFTWKLWLPNNIFRLLVVVLFSRLLPTGWRRKLWNHNPWLGRIANARAHFSIAGGDSFSDIYGLTRYFYVTLPQLLILLMQRPLVQLPQTYGPFRTAIARAVTRFILRRSHTLFSRDEAGRRTVSELLPAQTPAVRVVPDIGLSMSPRPLPNSLVQTVADLKARDALVGINASRLLYMGGYSGTNMFGLRENFPSLIKALVIHLAAQPGIRVLLVPHVCGGEYSKEDETRLCRDLAKEFEPQFGDRVVYLDHPLDHREIKALIGQCDIFMGARMHACVAAVSQGVPAVCLAYSDKFGGVMAPLGPGARVVDLRTAATDEILSAVDEVLANRTRLGAELRTRLQHLPPIAQNLAALGL